MNKAETILIAEDDRDLKELVRMAGEKNAYTVCTADNGLDARELIQNGTVPDLIVLDINMPGMDGFSFCRWLRDEYPLIPVIFLSARSDEYDKVIALEIGGDDYLTKPFSMKELFARIKVSLRRVKLFSENAATGASAEYITFGDIRIDSGNWTCRYRETDVVLTISEFRILQKLVSRPDIVISRDSLAEAAFPDDKYNLGRSIDVHICRIRSKLQKINPDFDSIETVYQVGYKWKK